MQRVVIGDMEIVASAVIRPGTGYVSAVTVRRANVDAESVSESRYEWDEPVFESEAAALQFAWRRALQMARRMSEGVY